MRRFHRKIRSTRRHLCWWWMRMKQRLGNRAQWWFMRGFFFLFRNHQQSSHSALEEIVFLTKWMPLSYGIISSLAIGFSSSTLGWVFFRRARRFWNQTWKRNVFFNWFNCVKLLWSFVLVNRVVRQDHRLCLQLDNDAVETWLRAHRAENEKFQFSV